MPTWVLDKRVWAIGALMLAIWWAVSNFKAYGQARYDAGYNAYKSQVADQLKDYATKTAELETLRARMEARENEHAIELEEALRRASAASDALALEIVGATFACPNVGGDFIRLYNEATGATPTGDTPDN